MLLTLGAACACGTPATSPSEASLVITLTLVGGQEVQTAYLHLGARADRPIPSRPEAIPAEQVAVIVTDALGRSYPLEATAVPGEFRVALLPVPGATYRLQGTVNGRIISAETTMPSGFTVQEPADTIRLARDPLGRAEMRLPLRFDGPGVVAVAAQVVPPAGTLPGMVTVSEYGDSLFLFLRAAGTYQLRLTGVSSSAREWLLRPVPRGNITGAVGGFTGILVRTRVVVAE